MARRHVAYVDRTWGKSDEKMIVGDMYFTFQEGSDTRTTDIENLKNVNLWYINSKEAEEGGDTYSEEEGGEFAIYDMYEADIEIDDDLADDDGYLWAGTIDDETNVLIGVYVCATEEQAKWIEEDRYYKENKGVKYNYRNHEAATR